MAQFINTYTLSANETNYVLKAFDPNKVDIIDENTVFAPLNIIGNANTNQLTGNAESNLIDGHGGADTLIGGAGDDTYIVDHVSAVITEAANEGQDNVNASINWVLSANIENLTLTGTANINGTGNALNNILGGNSGNNYLVGGEGNDTFNPSMGADTLEGGNGDDLYWINDMNTVVNEGTNGGTDTVWLNVDGFDLSKLKNIEVVKFTKELPLTTDPYMGPLGADGQPLATKNTFIFDSKPVKGMKATAIQDFDVKTDSICLSKAVFSKISKGTLKKSAFHVGSKAKDAADRIVYNEKTGALYYDKDGSSKAAAVKFAILDDHLKLTAGDFFAL